MNEVRAKCIARNLCCVVKAIFSTGLAPTFWLDVRRVVNDLTMKGQKAVRTALRFLRLRAEACGSLAKALRYEWDSIQKVTTGKRAVTPARALRVGQGNKIVNAVLFRALVRYAW